MMVLEMAVASWRTGGPSWKPNSGLDEVAYWGLMIWLGIGGGGTTSNYA